jgi:hypothetical protein
MMGPGNVTGSKNYFIIMKYLLRSDTSQADLDNQGRPEKAPAFWAAFMAYVLDIKEAGIVLPSAGLESTGNGDRRPRARR